jgi:hypothetical protein
MDDEEMRGQMENRQFPEKLGQIQPVRMLEMMVFIPSEPRDFPRWIHPYGSRR